MEYYKQPLVELHARLVIRLNEKNMEIQESLGENTANLQSLILNRQTEINEFRKSIDKVQPFTPFLEGFKKDYESILEKINEIKP